MKHASFSGAESPPHKSWLKQLNPGWFIALLPLALTIFFTGMIGRVAAGQVITASYAWVPSFGVNFSFYVDGLSLVLALLISGIGTLVTVYAGGYLAGYPQLGRFFLYLLLFMAAMLGVVLSGNIITLFIFWELTSLSSYLLIGFNHRQAESRASALQALLVTGLGGLALLAGLILLGQIGHSWELSTLLTQGAKIRSHALYLPMTILILLGAFTKSAQFPFHFWLPNAMAAPTPVSAYLHSATMVKAGIFLLARLNPILGNTPLWQFSLSAAGATTMLMGAWLAWQQTDLKRILAYSTISALGTLVLLLGVGTPVAVKAAVVFLIVHSLYKGALFMAAGAIDHETGTRDITQLQGLRRAMPITFVAVTLAALSMAGALPLFVGYIGKKLIYEAALTAPAAGWLLTIMVLLSNIFTVVVAGMVAIRPFWRKPGNTPKPAHEAPPSLWLGPLLLAGLGLLLVIILEFVPGNLLKPFLATSATAIAAELVQVKVAAWSGFNVIFWLSLATLATGTVLYGGRAELRRLMPTADIGANFGPERGYTLALDGLLKVAAGQTRLLQHGYLRFYLLTMTLVAAGLVGYTLLTRYGLNLGVDFSGVRIHEVAVTVVILLATVAAVVSTSRLATIAALGAVGYGLSLLFVFYGAPDLAMTQMAVETLTVIILALTLYHLPRFSQLTSSGSRVRDALIALGLGGLMAVLALTALAVPMQSRLTPFFAENSVTLAKGRNIVNVILVDFRALDTLGEITVLAVAAIGIYALLKQHQPQTPPEDQPKLMPSLILSTATRYLLPLLLMLSIFLLLRGHNEPGGGFVGGLVAAAALALYAMALGLHAARQVLGIDSRSLIYFGLAVATVSGLPAIFRGESFMTGLWAVRELPVIGKLGTPLLFDAGVYLVVIGITLTIIFTLMETGTGQKTDQPQEE
jgi:multicomponent Na+:H+ antiporter subunit A